MNSSRADSSSGKSLNIPLLDMPLTENQLSAAQWYDLGRRYILEEVKGSAATSQKIKHYQKASECLAIAIKQKHAVAILPLAKLFIEHHHITFPATLFPETYEGGKLFQHLSTNMLLEAAAYLLRKEIYHKNAEAIYQLACLYEQNSISHSDLDFPGCTHSELASKEARVKFLLEWALNSNPDAALKTILHKKLSIINKTPEDKAPASCQIISGHLIPSFQDACTLYHRDINHQFAFAIIEKAAFCGYQIPINFLIVKKGQLTHIKQAEQLLFQMIEGIDSAEGYYCLGYLVRHRIIILKDYQKYCSSPSVEMQHLQLLRKAAAKGSLNAKFDLANAIMTEYIFAEASDCIEIRDFIKLKPINQAKILFEKIQNEHCPPHLVESINDKLRSINKVLQKAKKRSREDEKEIGHQVIRSKSVVNSQSFFKNDTVKCYTQEELEDFCKEIRGDSAALYNCTILAYDLIRKMLGFYVKNEHYINQCILPGSTYPRGDIFIRKIPATKDQPVKYYAANTFDRYMHELSLFSSLLPPLSAKPKNIKNEFTNLVHKDKLTEHLTEVADAHEGWVIGILNFSGVFELNAEWIERLQGKLPTDGSVMTDNPQLSNLISLGHIMVFQFKRDSLMILEPQNIVFGEVVENEKIVYNGLDDSRFSFADSTNEITDDDFDPFVSVTIIHSPLLSKMARNNELKMSSSTSSSQLRR